MAVGRCVLKRRLPLIMQLLISALAIGLLVSILTLVCLVRAGYKIFCGHPTTEPAGNSGLKEVPVSIWLGMVVLAVLCLVIGVYPQLLHPLLHRATESILAVYRAGAIP